MAIQNINLGFRIFVDNLGLIIRIFVDWYFWLVSMFVFLLVPVMKLHQGLCLSFYGYERCVCVHLI